MTYVDTGKALIDICNKDNCSIWEYTLRFESRQSNLSEDQIFEKMKYSLKIMQKAANDGLHNIVKSGSGLIGGDAFKLNEYVNNKEPLTGKFIVKAMARALSCSEVNAAMGKIVAAPTAGSCGILPAVLISAGEKLNSTENDLVKALLTASGIGIIIAKNATLSGAEGGCQAECGSAAAMASAAIVEMMGGSVEESLNAAAIVIKNVLGLVCDPVAGLVEVPCAKRNIAGTVLALATADMVISGVSSKIPFDDAVSAMYQVGKSLPASLRETALGGLAATPTGILLAKQVLA